MLLPIGLVTSLKAAIVCKWIVQSLNSLIWLNHATLPIVVTVCHFSLVVSQYALYSGDSLLCVLNWKLEVLDTKETEDTILSLESL